ncbi:MAG TPA: hypothetical protein VGL24_06865 [Chthoniobacterales bacterium]
MAENVSKRRRLLAPVLENALWVGGLTLLIPAFALACPGLDREGIELLGYVLLGTVFPITLIGFVLLSRRREDQARFFRIAQFALGAGLLIAGCIFVFLRFKTFALVAALLQGLVLWLVSGRPVRNPFGPESSVVSLRWIQLLPVAVVMVLLWTVAGEFLYWARPDALVMRSSWAVLAFLGCVVLTSLALRPLKVEVVKDSARRLWVSRCSDAIAIVVFGAMAANPLPLTIEGAYAHWGCFVGPAELVRSGGWLLWDAYAQYGFLSTLAIAFFPVGSTWQAVYLLNAALLLGTACILYALLRSIGGGLPHRVFCFVVVAFAVFLIPGKVNIPSGVQMWPSVGAFRFFWCYALLAMVLWITSRSPAKRSRLIYAGSVVWVLGSLWSSESLVYCTAIWLPVAVLLRIDASGGFQAATRQGIPAFLRDALTGLLFPAALLVATLLVITGWYVIGLGHFPDPLAFFDAALAFSGGFSALPLGPSAWVPLAAFWILAVGVARCLRLARVPVATLAACVGAWSALWSTHSYVVGHSHATSCANLTPVVCCSLGAMLVALKRSNEPDSEHRLLRAMVVPFFAMVLFAPLASDEGLVSFFRQSIPLFERAGHIDSVLVPEEPQNLRELIEHAGVKPEEPIQTLGIQLLGWIAFDDASGEPKPRAEHPVFLPLQPAWNFYPLVSRRYRIRKYFERFAARSQASGWLLIPREGYAKWTEKYPSISHRAGRTYTNDYGRLVWMEYAEGANAVAQDKK